MKSWFSFPKILFTILILIAGARTALAQVPQLLNYQGRVAVNGTNFTGTGQFKFALIGTSTNATTPATASGTVSYGFLVHITINNGGSGYITAPAVTITDSTGTGATAYPQTSGGAVTNIVVATTGYGYSASPTINIAPPPQAAINSLWSNDGSSSVGGQPATSVPLPVTRGLYSVLLGDTTLTNMAVLPASVFANPVVWLRVWFNDGTTGFQQLTPDQRLAAVGYAIMAGTVPDGSITSSKIAAGAIGTAQLAPGSIGAAQLAPGAGGTLMVQFAGATNLQAIPNYFYFVTNAVAAVVTLPANPAVGDRVRVIGNSGGFTIIANLGQSIEDPPSSSLIPRGPFGQWQCVASSSDGSKLVAGQLTQANIPFFITPGFLYTSTDYGVTWSNNNNAGSGNWQCVASSSDGSKLVAGQSGGNLYTSTDYGVTWSTNNNAGSNLWSCVASSSDGSKLVAGQSGGNLYTSTDYGVTWSTNNNAGSGNWQCVASSSDGNKLVAGQSGGNLYTSTDYGVTWSTNNNAGSGNWQCVASSSDGSKLVAGKNYFHLYTSTDYGVTWSTNNNAGSGNWQCVASSSDGSKLVAGKNNWNSGSTNSYTSTDYGVTWSTINAGPGQWQCVASSSDGNKLVAGQIQQGPNQNTGANPRPNGGYLYAFDFVTHWSTIYVYGSAFANIELLYAGSGLWLPTYIIGSFTIR